MKVSNSIVQFATVAAVALLAASGLQAADTDEAGFEHLFNGKDLTGWKTDAHGWLVADGAISASPLVTLTRPLMRYVQVSDRGTGTTP